MTDDVTLLRRRALGRGLACRLVEPGVDVGRDVALARGPDGLALEVQDGMDNLVQCLEIALTTTLGSDVFDTGFGFDGLTALVEESDPVLVRERVRVGIIRLLRADPRVRRIVDLKLVDRRLSDAGSAAGAGSSGDLGDDVLDGPIDRWRTVDVRVAFEAVSGDRAVVDLGKVTRDG
jgi:phage baseplate assembly protein W